VIERLTQVAHDVELVEQNRCLRRAGGRHVAKRLPHVHHCQANTAILPGPQPVIEPTHAGLGAVGAAQPDRPAANQIAHHDPVDLALANRYFVEADDLGARLARAGQLRRHILLVQLFDSVPIEVELLGDVLDRRLPAAPADEVGKRLV
jgi:hypothetical protein